MPWDRSRGVLAAGAFWRWIVRAGRGAGRQLDVAGDSCYLEVKYEDLVAEPQVTLDRIGEFISHALDHQVIVRNGVGSVSQPNTSFPGSSGGFSGRWQKELAPAAARRLEGVVGPVLDELGYRREFGDAAASDRWQARLDVAPYLGSFAARQWLKSHIALVRKYADLSLFAPPSPDTVHPMPVVSIPRSDSPTVADTKPAQTA